LWSEVQRACRRRPPNWAESLTFRAFLPHRLRFAPRLRSPQLSTKARAGTRSSSVCRPGSASVQARLNLEIQIPIDRDLLAFGSADSAVRPLSSISSLAAVTRLEFTMRLLNVESRQLHTYYDDAISPYAILSHTWDQKEPEVSFEGMKRPDHILMTRYEKIKHTCRLAKVAGLEWVWIDTCCI